MECRNVHIQKDTVDSTGALTVQINSGSYVNGISFNSILLLPLYKYYAENREKSRAHLWFFAF